MSTGLVKFEKLRSTLRLCLCYRNFLNATVRNCSYQLAPHNEDVLDNFTSKLMETKYQKWKTLQLKQKFKKNKRDESAIGKILSESLYNKCYSETMLTEKLTDAINSNNAILTKQVINSYVEQKNLPPSILLLQSLSLLSQTGDVEGVNNIIDLCNELQSPLLAKYSDFKHYLAMAVWIKGNITQSLDLFNEVYVNNSLLRMPVRAILKFLILRDINKRSGASLVKVISFSESLVKDFNDFHFLACTWEVCFLSDWYSDQCIALDLLKRHTDLHKAISNRLPIVIGQVLNRHKQEIVYRLLEQFLKNDERDTSAKIVGALFDYRIRQGDLHACAEILKWCSEQNLSLPSFRKQQYFNLFLNSTGKQAFSNEEEKLPSHKLNYKF